ncbi:MAG: 4Fe-4S binding protein, partial [Phocaeicola sp.]
MLKRIRQLLAFCCFIAVTLLFLDCTGVIHLWLGFIAKVQFIPAVLAINGAAILFVIVLTALFGRIYCSVICPLGVMQDGIARIGTKTKKKKQPYNYSPARKWLRYTFLVLFVVALVAHIGPIASFLDPYAIYGRIANSLLLPIWQMGNNLLATLAERMDSYALYQTDIWIKSMPTLLVAILSFLIVAILSFRNGRTYCNTICPVGTTLGFLSRYAGYRVLINEDRCNGCMRCARNCKSSCINIKEKSVDHSRCVSCFNCLSKCKRGAIQYGWSYGAKPSGSYKEEYSKSKEKKQKHERR